MRDRLDYDGLRRVVEVPRASDDGCAAADPFRVQRIGALIARFQSGAGRLVWAWHRGRRGGPISLLCSDPRIAPASSAFADPGRVADELGSVQSWVAVGARHDGLLDAGEMKDRPSSASGGSALSVESCLVAVWDEPFTLVVSAEPILLDDIRDELDRTVEGLRYAQQRKESNPDRGIEYERLRAWHRELRRSESTGLWRVTVSAGAADDESARMVAGLATASFDLADTGYTLTVGRSAERSADGESSLAGTELLAALTRPPTVEVPGIRLVLPSEFDVTAEHVGAGGVRLGWALDRQRREAGRFEVGLASLNRHTFICGATGAGKSQSCRHLLAEAAGLGVPFMVVEPAKSEYADGLAARLPRQEIIRIRPGDPAGVACCVDPLRPADGFPLQTHLDLTKALFLAAFDADEPFPQVLSAALTRAYEQQGWNLALSAPVDPRHRPRYPTLADLQQCAMRVVDEIGYGREVEDNIRGFVKVRLGSLRLGTTGRFLEGGHRLDIAGLLRSNVVLEIEDIGDDHEKAFVMGAILVALTEHYRVLERRGELEKGRLRRLTVFEEAHRLLRRPPETGRRGAAAQAVEMFASLLAEVRAYGEGIVVAEQIPAELIPDVIKNTAVKIVHRLPAKDDRDAVGATMNLSDAQSKYLVTVPPGVAGCFADGMDQPILARMPDGTDVEAGGTASPVDAETLVDGTFGRCDADYGLRRVTVATVARGKRLVDGDQLLRWWGELAVLAHLTGSRSMPPHVRTLRTLVELGRTAGRSAIAHAVDEAVAARSGSIADRMSPTDLASHVAGELIGLLDGVAGCGAVDDEWLAAPFRWESVWAELRRHCATDPPGGCGGRHPLSGVWKDRHGVRIPGRTCKDQLVIVQLWRRQAQGSVAVEDLVSGLDRPSALERSAGLSRLMPEWSTVIERYLEPLEADWAGRLLVTEGV